LFNKTTGEAFDTLDDDFVLIVSSQAVAILQNALRSFKLHQGQTRVFELLRATTDVVGHNSDVSVHVGLTRVLTKQLQVDEVLLFVVRGVGGSFVASGGVADTFVVV